MHHCHTCPELGVGQAALRRVPCNCLACDEVMTQPWVHEFKDPVGQPRFKNPERCFFKPLFEDENEWHFVQLHEKKGTSKEEVDEENQLVFRNKTISVSRSIQVGNIGACAWMDEGGRKKGEEKDYYLVEFLELPKTAQSDKDDSAWTVECQCLNAVPTAPLWHTRSLLKVTVDVTKLVAIDLKMHHMSPTYMMKCRSKRVREEAEQKKQ